MARPSKLTEDNRSKLLHAAAYDASTEEMAYLCGVTRQTINNWLNDDQELFDEVERLRQKPVYEIRKVAVEKAKDSYSNAMDYLKRKRRKEMGDNVDVTTGGDSISIVMPQEVVERLDGKTASETTGSNKEH